MVYLTARFLQTYLTCGKIRQTTQDKRGMCRIFFIEIHI